ncbi:MAG: hypothetical protein DWP97_07465 [Calditrichaeota bacterium]|nr:MAG: hypothetical protein DWP97_07465 [Calditrichota bacterium]
MKITKQKKLLLLIDEILQEETEFRINLRMLQIDDSTLYEAHRECRRKFIYDPKHEKLHKSHEKVFNKYHQFIKQHKLLVKHCVTLLDQLKSNCYNPVRYLEDELMLTAGLKKTKDDHNLILDELKTVRKEHFDYLTPQQKKKQ